MSSTLAQRVSAAEAAIHAAALDPGRWTDAAHAVRKVVGGHSVNLAINDIRQTEISLQVASGLRQDDAEFYKRHILPRDDQLDLLRLFRDTPCEFSNTHAHVPDMERLWAYQAFYRNYGYCHFGVILIGETPTHRSWLTVARAAGDPKFHPRGKHTLHRLRPHLIQALEVNRVLAASGVSRLVHESLIDRIRAPFLLLDGNGRVVACNREATEAVNRGLFRLAAGRFELIDSNAQRSLGLLLEERRDALVASTIRFVAGGTRATAYVSRTSGADGQSGFDSAAARWAVFVLELRPGFEIPLDLLHQFFDLSRAESAVVSMLAAGYATERIARELKVTRSTLRTHLKSVYRKTATNSQAQLIAMLAATFPITVSPD